MPQMIPYELFEEYIQLTKSHPKNEKERIEHYKNLDKHFRSMEAILWEDIEKLSKEELERIPISWLYDWAHVTANYEYQEKIPSLYDKYGITKLTNYQYYNKYFKKDK